MSNQSRFEKNNLLGTALGALLPALLPTALPILLPGALTCDLVLLLLAALDPATGKKFIIEKTFNSFSISDFYLLEAWLIADLLLAGLEDILKSK